MESVYLLDANLLIALGDSNHVHHRRVQEWFHSRLGRGWATCPLTENAFLRIVGGAGYPGGVGGPTVVRSVLSQMCTAPGHQFWEDEISLRQTETFPTLPTATHLTDIYLLALAVKRRGRLATLDRRINPRMVPGGTPAYFSVP